MSTPFSALVFAKRMAATTPSAIREILKVTERPDVLSFAGGLPAPELFPAEALAETAAVVFAEQAAGALQYGVTEGYGPLREWVAQRYTALGLPTRSEQILITHGSQQGIELVAHALLDAGDAVVVEDPTYLAALQVFRACEAVPVPVESDDQGMRPDALAEQLRRRKPALIYLVPTFQNPTGRTLSEAGRQELVSIATAHGVPILADEPYAEIRFAGQPLTPLPAFDEGLVIQLGTFSKTLAPGLRLGWVRAAPEVRAQLTILKQAQDLHTSSLTQRVVAQLLQTFDYSGHLERVRETYRRRHAAMDEGLREAMPTNTSWTRPEGGLFVWVQLPPGVSDTEVFERAVKERVAVVPGTPFFVAPHATGHLRLSFSNREEPLIRAGMSTIGAVVSELIRSRREIPRSTVSSAAH